MENLYKAFITFIRKFLAINIHSSMPKYMKELSDGAKKIARKLQMQKKITKFKITPIVLTF